MSGSVPRWYGYSITLVTSPSVMRKAGVKLVHGRHYGLAFLQALLCPYVQLTDHPHTAEHAVSPSTKKLRIAMF